MRPRERGRAGERSGDVRLRVGARAHTRRACERHCARRGNKMQTTRNGRMCGRKGMREREERRGGKVTAPIRSGVAVCVCVCASIYALHRIIV